MIVVKTKRHTIINCASHLTHKHNNYRVWEFCLILGLKDEVKHPSFKTKILKEYGLL